MTSDDYKILMANRGKGRNEQPARAEAQQAMPAGSKLEHRFLRLWEALNGPDLVREYEFARPLRKFRLDFCHLPTKTAIEIEGGVWTSGRHTRGSGFEADCEKYNFAAAMGFTVFRLTGSMITSLHVEPILRRCTLKNLN